MQKRRTGKIIVFLLGLAPSFWLGYDALSDLLRGTMRLTANPIEFITHYTGDWTLRLIIIGLFITPLRKTFPRLDIVRYRRMIGLFAFFYGVLHFLTWIWLDKFFDPQEMWADIIKRRYITAGMAAFLMLIPLAITSTKGWIRRLGKRWQLLHRLVYFAAIAGVIHYYWLVKSDIRLPVLYGLFVVLVLGWRVRFWMRRPASASRIRNSPEAVAR
ncbi:MAG TPA: protein-methionine-sulfoxide reductase heme-binding subunit MsrQ [Bryobacteraceae bacterium]|nr:protein-methionine-sulfoxide reductase heme-binding subunit MsrQ [Bryobacteraceae bacterium]